MDRPGQLRVYADSGSHLPHRDREFRPDHGRHRGPFAGAGPGPGLAAAPHVPAARAGALAADRAVLRHAHGQRRRLEEHAAQPGLRPVLGARRHALIAHTMSPIRA